MLSTNTLSLIIWPPRSEHNETQLAFPCFWVDVMSVYKLNLLPKFAMHATALTIVRIVIIMVQVPKIVKTLLAAKKYDIDTGLLYSVTMLNKNQTSNPVIKIWQN